MDYVPAHGNTNMLEDREDTSGARVFDGEDQGKWPQQGQLNACRPPFSVFQKRIDLNNFV